MTTTKRSAKVYSLIFDYDLAKMKSSGRHWADEAYKNKDYIFSYSAASIATFLHHNPKMLYTAYTDDCGLLLEKLRAYDVSVDYLDTVDASDEIREWTSHPYCFWPLIKVAEAHYDGVHDALKLDNDLTCLKPIDDLLRHRGAIVWKHERLCSRGRGYWGESYAARAAFGTDDFHVYNTGVLGLSKEHHERAKDIATYCEKLIGIDISPVHRFPDKPGVVAKTYSTSDQVAVNYFLHVERVPILEAHLWIDHICYEKSKQRVLDRAAYLLRK